jgi:hypothetical protein
LTGDESVRGRAVIGLTAVRSREHRKKSKYRIRAGTTKRCRGEIPVARKKANRSVIKTQEERSLFCVSIDAGAHEELNTAVQNGLKCNGILSHRETFAKEGQARFRPRPPDSIRGINDHTPATKGAVNQWTTYHFRGM